MSGATSPLGDHERYFRQVIALAYHPIDFVESLIDDELVKITGGSHGN